MERMRPTQPERKVTENRFGRERVKVLTIAHRREIINIQQKVLNPCLLNLTHPWTVIR